MAFWSDAWQRRLVRALLVAGLMLWALPVLAQGSEARHQATVAAMQPPAPPPALPLNAVRTPSLLAETPRLPSKARLRALGRAATTTPTPATPVQPPPEPSAKPEEAAAGTTSAPEEGAERISLRGDRYESNEGRQRVEGHVELKYQDYTIHSQTAEMDADRRWSTLAGSIELEAPALSARGQTLRVNLETEDWEMTDGWLKLAPDYFTEGLAEPMYLRARDIQGTPERVVGRDSSGTSCDREAGQEHYVLKTSQITLVTDKAVKFHRPTLYLLGRRILRYPWDLTLSLERKENRFLPEVGVNDVEGYYAKFALGYLLNAANSGFVRLHLTELRGWGLGVDHSLDEARQTAELSFFMEPEQGSVSGRATHRLKISNPLSSEMSLNWQEDSGYGLGQQSASGDLTLRYDTKDANTLLGFTQDYSQSSYAMSHRFASTLTHRERLGASGEYHLRVAMNRVNYHRGEAPDEELNTEFNWRHQGRRWDVNLLTQRRYDLDAGDYAGDASYYNLDRTPDLALSTDSRRLSLLRRLGGADTRATVYLGHFEQHPEDVGIYRAGFNLELPTKSKDLSSWSSLRTAGRFRQMFYDDESAQWVGDLRADYYQKLTRSWESRLSCNYSKVNGYAPLRLDYASSSSSAQLQIVRLIPDRLRLDFTFSQDFHNNYTGDAIVRSEFLLTPRNRLQLQSGYSVELSQWRPVNLRWIYAPRDSWWSTTTINYDIERGEFSRLSTEVDWEPNRLWRVQFLGGYTEYGGFDQADFKITRDLHCLLAQVSYQHATGEFMLGLGIKAFPSESRTFGIGGFGQQFESNFGDQY